MHLFYNQEMTEEEKKEHGDKISAAYHSKSPEEKKEHRDKISAAYRDAAPRRSAANDAKTPEEKQPLRLSESLVTRTRDFLFLP